ncbi:hypothetical protein [Mitsuaria sp. 7]|uniref:hypothetical protein n=1 Tax=Mitsuaria sp. 7 TaxID=1658665 RepID=UPI0007DD03EF|nr:hypothetical protein [Mitsuaria sp. 7]ANH68193.1 hypothetical protein ABE85_12590 [Mitsuaria sp. 7]
MRFSPPSPPSLFTALSLSLLLAACGGNKGDPGGKSPDIVAPACKVLRVTPEASVTAGFLDPLMTIDYTAATPGACDDFKLVDKARATVPTGVVAASEWANPNGGIAGSRTIEPLLTLLPDTPYGLQLNGTAVSSFNTGQQRRGALDGEVTDLPVEFGELKGASRIASAQINGLIDVLAHDYAGGNPIATGALKLLLRHELPHLASPNASFDAQVKRVRYRSLDASGAPITLSGLLVYPVQAPGGPAVDYNGKPLVIGQRGAESNDADAPSSGRNAMVLIGLAAAGKGHVYFTPDLIGRGDTAASPQAFLIAADTAAQTVDMLTAVNAYFVQNHQAQLGKDLRMLGPSQGAFSAMASVPHLARHTTIRLVSTGDGPFDNRHTTDSVLRAAAGAPLDEYSDKADFSRIPDYLGRVLAALRDYQHLDYDPKDVFDAGGQVLPSFLADYRAGKHDDMTPHLLVNSPASGSQRYDLPLAEFRMFHYSDDTLVPARNTVDMMARLQTAGQRVASVTRGDCREKSLLVKTLREFSHSKSLPHTICLPFQIDDFVGRLP